MTVFHGLDVLPAVSEARIRMEVQPAAERALKSGHPWVFEQSIRKQSREGASGDLAVIVDRKRRFLAVGLYDPQSVIRVKVLQSGDPAPIDRDWFRAKVRAAFAIRAPLAAAPHTDGYRLIHGENDGLPGLILDRYADTLVLKLYSAAWLPHLRDVLAALWEYHPAERLVLRLSRALQDAHTYGLHDGMMLYGSVPSAPVRFLENGLNFSADVLKGHKTGFFFDQRENRAEVGALSAGRDVLDVFAYSGGFSVYAASGGARSVLSVDISEPALQSAQDNFKLNSHHPAVQACDHRVHAGDAFDAMEALQVQGRRFGLIVVDSPSFAKRQAEVERALYAYERLSRLAATLAAPGAYLVMASCSSRVTPEAFFNAVRAGTGHTVHEIKRTAHALDHPIGFSQGAYLKALYLQMP